MPEAELEGLDLEHGELVRRHVARDRQVVGARPQVLSDRQDLDVVGAQVTEDLDAAFRDALADLPDGPGEDSGPAVLELVPVDRGDNRVVEPHPLDGLGDANRLAKVEYARPPGLDGAKAARSGAGIAQDHEGR